MIKSNYTKAYKEILEIIKYFPEEEYKKIPQSKIEFFRKNMDNNYNFTINPNIELNKQNLLKETNAIIVNLYLDYFATEIEKIKIDNILKSNWEKNEELKRMQYNPDDLFKNRKYEKTEEKNVKDNSTTELVEYRETFFTKFKKFIFNLLHIKKG